jgi:hypothetical protein
MACEQANLQGNCWRTREPAMACARHSGVCSSQSSSPPCRHAAAFAQRFNDDRICLKSKSTHDDSQGQNQAKQNSKLPRRQPGSTIQRRQDLLKSKSIHDDSQGQNQAKQNQKASMTTARFGFKR